jgi:hypothetical protein
LIKVQIVFTNGLDAIVAQSTPAETAARVEELMRKCAPRIHRVNVVAVGLETAEGVRMKGYFNMVDLDARIDQVLDRQGIEHFDLYEIAKYPRRRRVE